MRHGILSYRVVKPTLSYRRPFLLDGRAAHLLDGSDARQGVQVPVGDTGVLLLDGLEPAETRGEKNIRNAKRRKHSEGEQSRKRSYQILSKPSAVRRGRIAHRAAGPQSFRMVAMRKESKKSETGSISRGYRSIGDICESTTTLAVAKQREDSRVVFERKL